MEELVFRETVASLASTPVSKRSPLTGKLTRLLFHYPAGCNGLVDVSIQKGTQQIFPYYPDALALDDFTGTFRMNTDVVYNEYLTVSIVNHDNVNAHTITVTMHIDTEKEYPQSYLDG